MTASVRLTTCDAYPHGDGDEAELVGLLDKYGIRAAWQPWGSPVGDDELAVLRATWDYPDRRADFLHWCAAVPRLANPYQVVLRNTDKVYLADFAVAGLPVVPTEIRDLGEDLGTVADDFVIKPTVGAGSSGASRFGPATRDAAAAHLRSLHERGYPAIVQPYQQSVTEHGETSLVFIRGEYSHAFSKGPMLTGGVVEVGDELYLAERLGPAQPDTDCRTVARECVEHAATDAGVRSADLLYARVDLVSGDDGPLLLELELTEPSLGFAYGGPEALERFAAAIADLAREKSRT